MSFKKILAIKDKVKQLKEFSEYISRSGGFKLSEVDNYLDERVKEYNSLSDYDKELIDKINLNIISFK